MRFGKNDKLSPRYVGPFKVIKHIGKVAYEVEIPVHISAIHNVIHVSMLKKCVSDLTQVLEPQKNEAKANLSYDEKSVEILD